MSSQVIQGITLGGLYGSSLGPLGTIGGALVGGFAVLGATVGLIELGSFVMNNESESDTNNADSVKETKEKEWTDTPHETSKSRPPGDRTGEPNSIWEQHRTDGSWSITYYDEDGNRISREDYEQKQLHKGIGVAESGRAAPHEHRELFNSDGLYIGEEIRELDSKGNPIEDWKK